MTEWEYRPATRTIVNPFAGDADGEPIVIARDVDPRYGPLLAAAPRLEAYVRDRDRSLTRRRLKDSHRAEATRLLLERIDRAPRSGG